ncbi:29969_t:CDS:1, partial [Gigaspora margarita]
AQQRVKRKRSSRIKQSSSRPRRNKNPTTVVVPRLKGPRYAKTPVYPLPDSTIDKLVIWHASKYRDILNCNGKVTNQYKGGIYIEIIRNGQVRYSPVHKLIEAIPR